MVKLIIEGKLFASVKTLNIVSQERLDLVCEVEDVELYSLVRFGGVNLETLECEVGKAPTFDLQMIPLFLALQSVSIELETSIKAIVASRGRRKRGSYKQEFILRLVMQG